MTSLLSQASSGTFSAIEALYRKTNKKIFCMCSYTLEETAEAEKIFSKVYSSMLSEVLGGKIASEEEYETKSVSLAAALCRKALLNSDAQCLRIPASSNFSVTAEPDASLSPTQAVINAMPPLQRFLFILRRIGGLSDRELARAVRIDEGTLRIALQAERKNLELLLSKYAAAGSQRAPQNAKEYMELLQKEISDTLIPAELENSVISEIKAQTRPLEAARRKGLLGKIIGIAFAAVAIVGMAVAAVLLTKGSQKNDSTSSSASSADTSLLTGAEDITPTAYADIEIEKHGIITVALDGNSAPETVKNFTELAESGFYNGLTFHRIINGFMMQGGDPNADGTGGSENTVSGEFSANGFNNPISHTRGAISMARSSDYNGASSQFFIVQSDNTSLDGQYAAFGFVTEGMDIVDEICKSAATDVNNGLQEKENQPVIASITIRAEKQ